MIHREIYDFVLEENWVSDHTWPWEAIEVIEGTEVTTKTDIFALGCTIFEMLTLESPHFNKMVELGSDGGEGGGTLNFDESNDDDDAYNEALGKRPDLPGLITTSILVRCLIHF